MQKAVVLVVEGEALIRISAVQMVEDAGFLAVAASDPDEAIKVLETRNDIWAVFTEIVMCRTMTGLRLAKMIRDRWPPIHLILTSGRDVPKEDELPADGRFISKPYAAEDLVLVLRDFMASKAAPYRFAGVSSRTYGRMP